MSNLLEHLQAMQRMSTHYIEPTGSYIDRNGGEFTNVSVIPERQNVEEAAFINDMIYMLDGPEQRAAVKAEAEREDELDQLRMDLKVACDKCAVADSDRGRATAKLDVVKRENNELRDRLMESELSRARMTGYLARVEDNEPPRMVAQERPLNWYHR